jgi:ribosomal protein S27AE
MPIKEFDDIEKVKIMFHGKSCNNCAFSFFCDHHDDVCGSYTNLKEPDKRHDYLPLTLGDQNAQDDI